MPKSNNMYKEALPWNVFVGCLFNCDYCDPSFKAQMKRQKPVIDKRGRPRGCQQCYDYTPHFHEDRITKEYCKKHFAKAKDNQFIWVGSSGDISFIEYPNMLKILKKIEEYPDKTFFFQTKNPDFFYKFIFPVNVILGITLESDIFYKGISKASYPYERAYSFEKLDFPRKFVTIEPILEFNFSVFLGWIQEINPERVYIGYDSHKCNLPEPSPLKVKNLINELSRFTKVKTKFMKKEVQTKLC